MMRSLVYPLLLTFGAMMPAFAADSAASKPVPGPGPQELMEKVSQDLLRDLDVNREAYRQSPAELRLLVDKFLLPNFDVENMTNHIGSGCMWTGS